MTLVRRVAILASITAGAAILGSCATGSTAETANAPALSSAAAAGRQVASDSGCMSCHGANGEGGVGPAWQGLAGAARPLTDGTEVIADREYLIRSITGPGAQKVEGYAVAMPAAGLTDDQISSIVDYIEALG